MVRDKKHEQMVKDNVWFENFDELVALIKKLTAPKKWDKGNRIPGECYWTWALNMRCKYIDIRVDMRDGAYVLMDKDGKRISLKQLEWQYKSKRKKS